MLLLTRKQGETILIRPNTGADSSMTLDQLFANGPIEITVTWIEGQQVKLGIAAPPSLLILRHELDGHGNH